MGALVFFIVNVTRFFLCFGILIFPCVMWHDYNINMDSGSIHSIMLVFISVKLASVFSLCVAARVFCGVQLVSV